MLLLFCCGFSGVEIERETADGDGKEENCGMVYSRKGCGTI
jgi:hypothetical protein